MGTLVAAALVALGGLQGTVTRGPITPVCRAGTPCSAPAAHVTLTFLRRGVRVRSVVTGAHGAYRVQLPSGTYAVRATLTSSIERLTPVSVVVRGGVLAHRDFAIDTGIR